MKPAAKRAPRRWWSRAARHFVRLTALVLVMIAAATVSLLRNLDRPAVKQRLRALVRARAGLEIDYGTSHFALASGLRITDVSVRSPPAFRAVAPRLAQVDALEIGWASGGALAIAAHGVALTVVADEDGSSSLDALTGGPSARAPAPVAPAPLSHRPGALVASLPPIARFAVDGVSLDWITTERGRPMARLRVQGIAVRGELGEGGASRRVSVALGSEAAPLAVELAIVQGGGAPAEAKARLWAAATLSATDAHAGLELRLERQTFASRLARLDRLFLVDAGARFDAARGLTSIAVTRLEAADGAFTVELDAQIGDGGDAHVRHASGGVELARLLALAPAGLTPFTLGEGALGFTVDGLLVASAPRLEAGGKLDVEAHVERLLGRGPRGSLAVERARMSLRGAPSGPGGATHFTLDAPIGNVRLASSAGARLDVAALDVDAKARVSEHGPLAGELTLRFAELAAPSLGVLGRGGHATAQLADLHLDLARPLAARADVSLEGGLAALDLGPPGVGLTAGAEELTFTLRSRLRGHAPYALDGTIPIGRLRVAGPRGALLPPSSARVAFTLSELEPDRARWLRSTAHAKIDLELGALTLGLTLVKHADAADFQLAADASSLALVRLVAPPSVPWPTLALRLRSTGSVEQLSGTPLLHQRSELHLAHPAWNGGAPGAALLASALDLTVQSNGTRARQEATCDLRTSALSIDERAIGDGRASFTVTADTVHPSFAFRFDGQGAAGPAGTLAVEARFDAARRALLYRLDGKLARLGILAPFLDGVPFVNRLDLASLGVTLKGEGTLTGFVERLTAKGAPVFSQHPLETLSGEDASEVRLTEVHYAAGALELDAPAAVLRTKIHGEGAHRTLLADVELEGASLYLGDHTLELEGVHDTLSLNVNGDPFAGEVEIQHRLDVRKVAQDYLALYPVGGLRIETLGARAPDGTARLTALTLTNTLGGTRLALAGVIDVTPRDGRRGLSLTGQLEQKLEALSVQPTAFQGRGAVTLDLRVDSGDLELFHTVASVRFSGARVELPSRGVVVEGLDGEIPVVEDLIFDARHGARLVGSAAANSYGHLRFADQHPFLSGPSFLSAERVTAPSWSLGPLAGNLRIDRNLISLDQLELEVAGGRVTGQGLLDFRGRDSAVELRVRASHLQAVRGGVKEPFDGNAAITLSLERRSIEGRAEIIHIGRHHLFELLDLYDPHHADVPTNRLRRALGLGYPERARLLFDHGFASLLVEFGGLARLVRVDEIKGIPTGPLIDKYLGSLLAEPREEP